jgi:pyruvate formate lyase activating enzyme
MSQQNDSAADLRIGGFTPFTTIDYPGSLAAVVFCQGCPWQCVYCHNAHLVSAVGPSERSWPQVMAFLKQRQGLLDAVVFSGGEPTAQSAVIGAAREAAMMGYRIGLHTGGSYPRRLAALLPHVSWVGLDVKAPLNGAYAAITGIRGSEDPAARSLEQLIESGVHYEVRTTVTPDLTEDTLLSLARDLAQRGVRHYAVQECRPAQQVERTVRAPLTVDSEAEMRALFRQFVIRRA